MRRPFLCVCLLLVSTHLSAEVKLPSVLSEGMVLQQGLPVHLWGTAGPNEAVTAEFRGETKTTKPDSLGRWDLYLSPGTAGGPFALRISGRNTIRFQDVLVGEVWVASGQSNMEFHTEQIKDAEKELRNASVPSLRLLQIEKRAAEFPQLDVITRGWQHCTPATAAKFSAVAFLFGREINEREKVPVGIVDSSWGGTSIESWTSLEAIGADAALMPVIRARGVRMSQEAEWRVRREAAGAAKQRGENPPNVSWRPEPPMWSLSQLYNAMIAPLTAYPVRGVIWYQGEQNTRRDGAPELYGRQLTTLISDWRQHWGIGEFPFYFVQLPNFRSDSTEDWPAVREGQRNALQLRNTGMAVTIDIGDPDDVHPLNKQGVATRLALQARAQTYDESVEYSGPLFRQLTREGSVVRVWFDHAGSRLVVKGPTLVGFEVAGEDGRYYEATAQIDGETVLVRNADVPRPVSVRYAWANDPRCNLFNQEGLPTSPFRASLQSLH